jgi:hypothetical protein
LTIIIAPYGLKQIHYKLYLLHNSRDGSRDVASWLLGRVASVAEERVRRGEVVLVSGSVCSEGVANGRLA